jgi:DNA-binding PadR family transcriptional regulator
MSLDHAILGFLRYQPLSGYDLKKMFDTTVQHFWCADQSQIYRTLSRLSDRGWTQVEVHRQSARPDRRVYHVTQGGRAELRRWLRGPFPVPQPHDAALVKVFFAGQLTDAELMAMFEAAAKHLRGRLREYARLPPQGRAYEDVVRSEREMFFWELTLEAGIHSARARLKWVERVISRLRRRCLPRAERANRKRGPR